MILPRKSGGFPDVPPHLGTGHRCFNHGFLAKASVLALLALRADIELRSATGQTALHLAAIRGHPEITQATKQDWLVVWGMFLLFILALS